MLKEKTAGKAVLTGDREEQVSVSNTSNFSKFPLYRQDQKAIDFQEFFGEAITEAQVTEYREYANRLRLIENSDFVARELQFHHASMQSYAQWLSEGVEGADLCAWMVAHHRRGIMLCEGEIERRKRRGKYPPNAGLVFRDFRQEREEIRQRTLDIINTYTPLQKRGKEYVGFCIFHDDRRHPSLTVNAEKGLWYCFTCSIGGDVFDFIERAGGKNNVR